MEARGPLLMAGLLLLAADGLAAQAIYRCAGPGGVTYQEIPCPNGTAERVTDIPAQYPEIDREARERLFAREAALDARNLKREEMDTALRIAREERWAREREAEARQVMESLPVYYGPVSPSWYRNPPLRHPMHHQRLNGNAWPGFGRQ